MGIYKTPGELRKERKQARINRKPELLAQARRDKRAGFFDIGKTRDKTVSGVDKAVNFLPGMSAVGVLKYTMMPEILPRIRRLGFHFGHFAYLLALVFSSARLIPASHPVLNAANIGRFGVRQVIAIAANNLTWSKKNIDQIAIFIAIVIGLIMLVIQAAFIGFMALTGTANAQTADSFFTSPNPAEDPILIFLAQVFGNLDGFWGTQYTSANAPGSSTAIHEGVRQVLSLYSMATMVIAVIIVLYYILTVIGEAAKTGTPFGQRFNSLWAPIRLIVALGLLVPLGSGLNSAQYITLWVAKMGSGLGTQAWIQMSRVIDGNPERYELAEFSTPWMRELAAEVFFMEVCRQTHNKEISMSDPDRLVMPNIVEEINGEDGVYSYKVAYENRARFLGYFGGAYCGNVSIKMESDHASVISVPVEKVFTEVKGIILDMTNQYSEIAQIAEKYAKGEISVDGAGETMPLSDAFNQVMAIADGKDQNLRDELADEINQAQSEQLQKILDERENSWAHAGVWYLELSRLIQVSQDTSKNARPNTTAVEVSNLQGQPFITPSQSGIPQEMVDQNMIFSGVSGIPPESKRALLTVWRYYQQNKGNYLPEEKIPDACKGIDSSSNAFEAVGCFVVALIVPKELVLLAYPNGFPDDVESNTSDEKIEESTQRRMLDPMGTLLRAGYSITQRAWVSILAGAAMSGVSGILGAFGGAMGAVGAAIGVLGSIAILLGGIGLSAGMILYFLLPVFPFIYFFFAIVSWVMEIFEAVIAMPLWALAHLRIDGDGMPGQAAMNGYFLLLSILLRPAFIVIGLIAGALVFGAAIFLLQTLFANVLFIKGGGSVSGLELMIYTVIFAYLCYSAGITSFKLVDNIPNQILRWIGNGTPTFSEGKEDPVGGNSQLLMAGTAVLGGQAANTLSSGLQSAGQSTAKAGKGFADEKGWTRDGKEQKAKELEAKKEGALRDANLMDKGIDPKDIK